MGTSDSEADIQEIENSENTPPKKKLKANHHRQQKFREAWLQQEDFKLWLARVRDDPFKAKCKQCNMTFNAELIVLKNHTKSQAHQRRITTAATQPKINTFLKNSCNEIPDNNLATKRLEIKLCAFIAEHNISLRVLDHLTDLLKTSVSDSNILKNMQLKCTKGAAIIQNVIGETEKNNLQNKLTSNLFSILIDESTDIAAVKTMCIAVRFFDACENRVVSRLWSLYQIFDGSTNVDKASADHLYSCITKSFQERNVSLKNVIGFASDGCNTMMGSKNSVSSRFRADYPGISIIKCICHSLHLCASEACKVLPRICEDLARNVYGEFKNSAKRQHQFREFQTFLDIEIHKILRPAQTRWLSLSSVVKRMLEQWEALCLYFWDQKSTARLLAVDQLLQALENPLVKLFYLFLDWILPKFNNINLLFQSETVVLPTLYDKMSVAFQELLEAYMEKSYVMRTRLIDLDPSDKKHRLRPEQMYLGVKVMEYLNKLEHKENEGLKRDFRSSCAEFLVVGCSEIKKRFDFGNQTLQHLSYLMPPKAILHKTRIQMQSLLPLMKNLPRIVIPDQYQDIDNEWRQLPYFELPTDMNAKEPVEIFWSKLHSCDEGDQGLTFQNLSKFVLNVMSLFHANADCERIFSQVNLVKTKTRNKIVTPTLNGILLAKQRVQRDCVNYEPSNEEYSRMTKTLLYVRKPNIACSSSVNITDIYEATEDCDDIILPNNF